MKSRNTTARALPALPTTAVRLGKQILLTAALVIGAGVWLPARAARILIPMDEQQRDHLKAYGIAYLTLKQGQEISWLLNYRGGSFCLPQVPVLETECRVRGVSYEVIPEATYGRILAEIADPETNMEVVKLEVAPKIAVYTPPCIS